jgi:hypothetical protein
MSPDQRARALRLADVLDSFYQREVLETASFLRELAAEPVRVPMTDELAVSPQEVTEALRFVRTHLYAAQAQASPGDDSIIMRHVYDAYRRIADLTKEVELHGITGDAK